MKPALVFFLLLCATVFDAQAQQNWTLIKGDYVVPGYPIYGTMNQFSPDNTPGGRYSGAAFTYRGKLYHFAGSWLGGGYNDLWEYDSSVAQWRWIKGAVGYGASPGMPGSGAPPSYGTQGVAAPTNLPGGRTNFAWWLLGSKFYVYGGHAKGAGSSDAPAELWEYDFGTSNWRWLKGGGSTPAVYGTKGTPAATNAPGPRIDALHFTANGKLYLFAGQDNNADCYNDLWEYDTSTNNWTWIKGSNTLGNAGSLGTLNVPAAGNNPMATSGGAGWMHNGKFYYMMGRVGSLSGNSSVLWEYDLSTTYWTCIKTGSFAPTYGTKGLASASNEPGFRESPFTWVRNGKLCLYGGGVPKGSDGYSDSWEYNIATAQWTWTAGDSTFNGKSIYTLPNASNSINRPGCKLGGSAAFYNGGLYLFGGSGYALTENGYPTGELWRLDTATGYWSWINGHNNPARVSVKQSTTVLDVYASPVGRRDAMTWTLGNDLYLYSGGQFDDLWKYNTQTNNWQFLRGADPVSYWPVWGTKGVAAPANTPGARKNSATWAYNGKLYLFGGPGGSGLCNDMWEYDPGTNMWTWIAGPDSAGARGIPGTIGTGTSLTRPSVREHSISFVRNNKFYLYGGNANWAGQDFFNDLWEFDPSSNQWTWIKGDSSINVPGVYGTLGVAAPANKPGSRMAAGGWYANGKFFIFGGYGYSGNLSLPFSDWLADLWEFDFATGNWRWLKGGKFNNPQIAVYGSRGIGNSTTTPGERQLSRSWVAGGQFYLFGGYGAGPASAGGDVNDLWRYDPATNIWTWIRGSNDPLKSEMVCVRKGVGDSLNTPAASQLAPAWSFGNRIYLMGTGAESDLWYLDTCSNAAGCITTPQASLPATALVCSGKPVILNAGNTGGSKYLWSTGDTSQNICVTAAGNYWVKVTNAAASSVYDTIAVSLATSPVVNLGRDTTICANAPLTINGGSFVAAKYLWNSGDTTSSLAVRKPGTYILTVTAAGCWGQDSMVLGNWPVPVVSLGADFQYCAGVSIMLSANNTGSRYSWSTGDTTQTIFATSPGSYDVTVTNTNGCIGRDTIVRTDLPAPFVALGPDTVLCADSLVLDARSSGSLYSWNTGDTAGMITVQSSGIYRVVVTGSNSCKSYDTVRITMHGLPGADSIDIVAGSAAMEFSFAGVNARNAAAYNWDFGDGNSSTTGSPTYTYSAPGNYNVVLIITNAGGCTDTLSKSLTVTAPTGVGPDNIAAQIRIWPNPAGSIFWISNESSESLQEGALFSVDGRKVSSVPTLAPHKRAGVDLQGQSPGLYRLLLTTSSGQRITISLVKDR